MACDECVKIFTEMMAIRKFRGKIFYSMLEYSPFVFPRQKIETGCTGWYASRLYFYNM